MRYQRQISIKGWGDAGQERLSRSHIFIAGAGGLGSPVIMYLVSAGAGLLSVADYDAVELSNLNRQIIHNENNIGMNKARSAQSHSRALNSTVNFKCIETEITASNIDVLTEGADIIIDCLDNFKTRYELNRCCVRKKIPLVHGGVEDFHGQITFIHPPETACLNCFFPEKEAREKKVSIAGPTAGIAGAIMATETIKHLAGLGTNLKNSILFFDALDMKFEKIKISRNDKCPVCQGTGRWENET